MPKPAGRQKAILVRAGLGPLWLLLAASAALSGCDSRQGAAEALAERQSWGNSQAPGTISGNAIRGQQIAQEKCGACHGADGNGGPDPHVPKLAGQSLPYLYWEIRSFKAGTRKSDIMAPNVTALAYEDIADVATYFSQQTRKPEVPKDESRIAKGRKPDRQRSIPILFPHALLRDVSHLR